MKPITVFVPRDSSSRSVGADEVCDAIQARAQLNGIEVHIVRNGSRGLSWLEPLVEVATPQGRMGYGPVSPSDVQDLISGGMLDGQAHHLFLGKVEEIAFLATQTRLSFARVGVIDPLSIEDFVRTGGLEGLKRALEMSGTAIVEEISDSGLRGRGGAGFPAGIKWKTVLEASSAQKFVCANADEGDSGTFADRMLMEGDPFSLIEAMIIAGHAVGATEGYIYVRSEYPDAIATMRTAIDIAYLNDWLGTSVLGSKTSFDLFIRVGAGAYICGEETSMLESLEGRRGMVRPKPPLPAIAGLFGSPTIINNVTTLVAVPTILAKGARLYQSFGTGRSRGTQIFQIAGNVKHGGIVEVGFGLTLKELIYDYGGGSASGRPIRAVQVGGPLGAYIPPSQFDLVMDYEAFASVGAMVGHGGIVVFDDSVDMALQARFAMEFCAEESCGKCTPCRIGSTRGVEVIDRIRNRDEVAENIALLEDLCETMVQGSLCAMGSLTPMPVRSILAHFGEDLYGKAPIGR